MSTMETPPPEMTPPVPPGPPERRCPRCGSALAPDQEWCLACGAAAGTEVVESRGWRVPIYLGGGLVALGILGVILAIAALSDREEQAQAPTPTPSVSPIPPSETPSVTPLPTESPAATITPDPNETFTPDPTETVDPNPTETPTEEPPDTTDPPSGTFDGWTGADGDYTIIIASKSSLSEAETVAQDAQDKGHTVGILSSDDFSSLNGGYQVVFVGTYTSQSDAEDALSDVKSDYGDAYVKRISNSS